jgi:hypothetical protein
VVTNPAFGVNPKKWYSEVMKAKRLDVSRIKYTEQEEADLAKQPPPEVPQDHGRQDHGARPTRTSPRRRGSDRDTQFARPRPTRTR